MSALGFTLVFTAALCHAIWNFCVKQINAGSELIWLFSLCSLVLYFPIAAYFWLHTSITMNSTVLFFVIGSAIIHLVYFLFLQFGYRHGELSVVYPTARATGPIISSGLAVLLLNEELSFITVCGGLLIIFSVFRLGKTRTATTRNAQVSLWFGIVAGIVIGAYTVWDAYTVSALMFSPLLLDYMSSLGRCVLLLPDAYKRQRQIITLWEQHKWLVITIALFNPLAYLLVLYAMTFTPVIYVAPIRESSVLVSVLIGCLILKEGQVKHKLLWGILILCGIVILCIS